MKFNAVLLVALVGLFQGTQGQLPNLPPPSTLGNFIVAIAEVRDQITTARCAATIYTVRHALTTAHCVSYDQIIVQVNYYTNSTIPETTNFQVSRVTVHPSYVATNNRLNNVAVVRTTTEFPVGAIQTIGTVQPRTLGILQVGTCQLMGVGSVLHNNPITNLAATVNVLAPANCIPTDTQAYCSSHIQLDPPTDTTDEQLTCAAIEGSPVLCGNGASLDGLLISDGCFSTGVLAMVQYHPIQIFRAWIDEVSQDLLPDLPELPPPSTLGRFVVAIAQVQEQTTTVRCAGTAFTRRHVLTTAVCVSVPEIIVQVNFFNASNSPASMNFHVARTFIHPSFLAANSRLNNVAVVHTWEEFPLESIQIRTLGVLAPAMCQLMGVGSVLHSNEITNLAANVTVLAPANCVPTDTQAYCSIFAITNPPTNNVNQALTCNAIQGSPVLCGNGAAINGFLISEGCTETPTLLRVQYHGVQTFRAWIDEVSGAETNKNISLLLLVSAAFMAIKNMI